MNVLRRVLFALGFVLCVGAILFTCDRVAERGRFALPYSTFGAGPDGSRALLELTRNLGFDATPFSRELLHLPRQATLVAIGGCDQPLAREVSRPEREELMRWLEAGGLLIVAGAQKYLPEEAGLTFSLPATCKESGELPAAAIDADAVDLEVLAVPFEIEAIPEGPPLTYAEPITMTRARTVDAKDDTEATVLIESEYGPVAMTTPVGRGRVVLLGSGSPFVNGTLRDGGGAIFARLLKAFGKGPVLFDEYHLGMGERRSLIGYLRDLGLAPALIQLCLVALLFLFARGQRLGPPREDDIATPRVTQRYLEALGELYARTKDTQGALKSLGDHGMSRIARHYRLLHVPLAQVPATLRAQGLLAVASYAERVSTHGSTQLAAGESILTRARDVERDVRAALVVGDA